MKTRDKILCTARQLFNEHRFGAVTTAAIAEAAGIAEGNLWYHFRSKRALLDALSTEFAGAIEARLAMRPQPDEDIVGAYMGWLLSVMHELNRYRFLYRDRADYGEHSAVVLDHIAEWYDRTHSQLMAYLGAMVDQGLLDWPRAGLSDLCVNALIILRFGLEYQREVDPVAKGDVEAARWTVRRHLTLFEDRLDALTARRFHRVIEEHGMAMVA